MITNVHFLIQVEGLPGYVLEPDPLEVREAEVQTFQSRSNRHGEDAAAMTDASEVRQQAVALKPASEAAGKAHASASIMADTEEWPSKVLQWLLL